MPYLQLDIPNRYPVDVKRDLARRLGETFALIMQTRPDLVTVAFRELGEGGVWWCGAGGPEPAALLSCDTRRGRPREQRAELAQALIDARVETLGLRSDRLVVEFTQHTGDEMYRHGRGWSVEWTPTEAMTSESLSTERPAVMQKLRDLNIENDTVIPPDVRFWHKAEIMTALPDVRFRG